MRIENIVKVYGNGPMAKRALNGISITFPDAGLVFITGKSGSGKSTLLNLLGGLLSPSSGAFIVGGKNMTAFSEADFDDYRNHYAGIIFQDYNLIENFTVEENQRIPLVLRGVSGKDADERIDKALAVVGMSEFKGSLVRKLSGGERQRVAISRALIKEPKLILADEPTGNLDSENSKIIYEQLKKISRDNLVICVTHDEEAARTYGDRIIVLKDGTIEKDSVADSLYNKEKARDKLSEGKNHSLSPGFIYKFSVKYLIQKIIRLSATLISFMLTSLLFMLSLTLWSYDEAQATYNYIDRYDIKEYIPYQKNAYTNVFKTVFANDVYNGKALDAKLQERFGEDKILKVKRKMSVLNKNDNLGGAVSGLFLNNDCFLPLELKEGHIPIEATELLITDYVADKYALKTDDDFFVDRQEFIVSGIVATDYAKRKIIVKLATDTLSGYDSYLLENVYDIIYFPSAYLKQQQNGSIIEAIEGAGLSEKVPASSGPTGILMVIGPDNAPEVLMGRSPEADNEAMVSLDVAQSLGFFEDPFVAHKLSLSNLHDEKYNGTYDGYFNLFDYFPEGMMIVGIMSENNGFANALSLTGPTFSAIRDDYYRYYYHDETRVVLDEHMSSPEVEQVFAQKILIDEPSVGIIYGFGNFMDAYTTIIISLLVVFCIITIIMVSTYISSSVSDAQKDLGILRSLGVRKKDTNKIFALEAFFISFITIMLLFGFAFLSLHLINRYFQELLIDQFFDILYFDALSFIITSALIFFIAFISFVIPLNLSMRKKPIDLIRNISI